MLLLSADILSLTNPAWMHVDDPLHYLFAKVHCAYFTSIVIFAGDLQFQPG